MNYTAYQARTQWYMDHFGPPASVRKTVMEDGETALGVLLFAPVGPADAGRQTWTFATNGMSERRMPCLTEPHGNPSHRMELLAYAAQPADWVGDLLAEVACYPFRHQSGLSIGHTMPVQAQPGNLWSGYLLMQPRLEPEEFNPLGLEVGYGDDWVFFAEVVGLLDDELRTAISMGGPEFASQFLTPRSDITLIDTARSSVLLRDA